MKQGVVDWNSLLPVQAPCLFPPARCRERHELPARPESATSTPKLRPEIRVFHVRRDDFESAGPRILTVTAILPRQSTALVLERISSVAGPCKIDRAPAIKNNLRQPGLEN